MNRSDPRADLLSALLPFALAAEGLDPGDDGHIWEHSVALEITGEDLRKARAAYVRYDFSSDDQPGGEG